MQQIDLLIIDLLRAMQSVSHALGSLQLSIDS